MCGWCVLGVRLVCDWCTIGARLVREEVVCGAWSRPQFSDGKSLTRRSTLKQSFMYSHVPHKALVFTWEGKITRIGLFMGHSGHGCASIHEQPFQWSTIKLHGRVHVTCAIMQCAVGLESLVILPAGAANLPLLYFFKPKTSAKFNVGQCSK